MIAKAATISHGGNAVRYSVNKDKAEIVKVNFLPDDISAEAMYQRMVLKQKEFASIINKGRPLKRNMIRMEISPTKEESTGWTLDDWARLANEYIQVFDSIDLSKKASCQCEVYQHKEQPVCGCAPSRCEKWHTSSAH